MLGEDHREWRGAVGCDSVVLEDHFLYSWCEGDDFCERPDADVSEQPVAAQLDGCGQDEFGDWLPGGPGPERSEGIKKFLRRSRSNAGAGGGVLRPNSVHLDGDVVGGTSGLFKDGRGMV
jgi:hypothetical protein